jgi:NADPH-dependent 2,4-dienoyl-CoA reductase/sulfur reductase-like enzyme
MHAPSDIAAAKNKFAGWQILTMDLQDRTSDNLLDDPSKLHIIVVGSGIAGLTAAVACREKGFTVTVLEASEKFSHVSFSASRSSVNSRGLYDAQPKI